MEWRALTASENQSSMKLFALGFSLHPPRAGSVVLFLLDISRVLSGSSSTHLPPRAPTCPCPRSPLSRAGALRPRSRHRLPRGRRLAGCPGPGPASSVAPRRCGGWEGGSRSVVWDCWAALRASIGALWRFTARSGQPYPHVRKPLACVRPLCRPLETSLREAGDGSLGCSGELSRTTQHSKHETCSTREPVTHLFGCSRPSRIRPTATRAARAISKGPPASADHFALTSNPQPCAPSS